MLLFAFNREIETLFSLRRKSRLVSLLHIANVNLSWVGLILGIGIALLVTQFLPLGLQFSSCSLAPLLTPSAEV